MRFYIVDSSSKSADLRFKIADRRAVGRSGGDQQVALIYDYELAQKVLDMLNSEYADKAVTSAHDFHFYPSTLIHHRGEDQWQTPEEN
jgi:hypothetical protein